MSPDLQHVAETYRKLAEVSIRLNGLRDRFRDTVSRLAGTPLKAEDGWSMEDLQRYVDGMRKGRP
jgi:hypothetical protein